MYSFNDPIRKKAEFIVGIGSKMVSDKNAFVWYPVSYEGENATPKDWEVPTNLVPSPNAVAKYRRGKRLHIMKKDLQRARYLNWKFKNGGFETFKEQEEYRKKLKGLGIMIKSRKHWVTGWKKKLIKTLENGFALTTACSLLKLPGSSIKSWYRKFPDFKSDLDQAMNRHKERLVESLDYISFEGESETNRLNAIKFHLERKYSDEFGQKSIVSVGEVEAPMDVFLGSLNEEDEEEV